ncbi:hypothetical protein BP6252_03876 [Coleophoma cylindrospora]|uniref:Carboxylesterase type B domain-containing protein n=1 Tax=Coleophoma cylindrospora TaxID=1849047 RepID=A0A3D8S9I2_9HELO|nr:hypothetical protein BP6252_03876 [Coleophoma cylindrospora]
MDQVAACIAKHGNVWSLVTNNEMESLFEPLHAARASSYKTKVKVEKGFKYGPSDRHRIDLYTPITTPDKKLPVLVFFHGGGFLAGDNDITPSMHGHIGNYFASNNTICALATYRVIPEAVYPSGAQDVTSAFAWIRDNISQHGGDPNHLTAVAQSAGASHLAAALFSSHLSNAGITLQGAILLSAPLWYDLRQERRKRNMYAYHEAITNEEVLSKTGVAQFIDSEASDLPHTNILLVLGELDPNEIVDGNLMFVDAYRKRFSRLPILEVLKGQNHISYFLGLGLDGDRLGKRILEFVALQ